MPQQHDVREDAEALHDGLGSLEQTTIETDDGREIAVWRSGHETPRAERRGTLLLTPGFCKRMYNLATLTQYLAFNGFEVYRYDPLDHLGPSTGELPDYTMSTGHYSMKTVLDWLHRERDVASVGMVATSLSARNAYRMVSERDDIDFLLTAVGVTDVKATLARVFGVDYGALTEAEQLPEVVMFEDKHPIRARRFWADGRESDWWAPEPTREELDSVSIPIVAFAARGDDWVLEEEVEAALNLEAHPERQLCKLAGSGHDLSRNPKVAQAVLLDLTGTAMSLAKGERGRHAVDREPTFTQITSQIIKERRLHGRA